MVVVTELDDDVEDVVDKELCFDKSRAAPAMAATSTITITITTVTMRVMPLMLIFLLHFSQSI